MKLSNSVKSISYLKQHTADAVRTVTQTSDHLVITQNGEAKAVLMGIAEYEKVQESLALLKILSQSQQSLQEGRYKTARKALADVRSKIRERGF